MRQNSLFIKGRMLAPWTSEQIALLERYQTQLPVHEYTCPKPHKKALVVTENGLICPVKKCGYSQNWAMPESWHREIEKAMSNSEMLAKEFGVRKENK